MFDSIVLTVVTFILIVDPDTYKLLTVILFAYKVPTVAPAAPKLPELTSEQTSVPAETVPLACTFAVVTTLAYKVPTVAPVAPKLLELTKVLFILSVT